MSTIRHLGRLIAVSGAALLATVVVAGPAAADEASVQLAGLPSQMTPGGSATQLAVAVKNNTRTPQLVQVLFRIRLEDLDADEVMLGGLSLQEEDGELRAAQNLGQVDPRQVVQAGVPLQFLAGAPAGRATVTVDVFVRDRHGEFKRVDSDRKTTTLGAALPTPSPTEAPTVEPTVDGATPSPTGAAAGLAAGDSGSGHWPLYIVGFILLAAGGGAVSLLLLRRPREAVADEPYMGYGGRLSGYPGDDPTAVFPRVPPEPRP
jgi:hypothetical protein